MDKAKRDYSDEEIRNIKNPKEKATALVNMAVKDGKITKHQVQNLKKMAVDNFDAVEALLASIRLGHVLLLDIEHLSYDELFSNTTNGLEILKKYLPDRFKEVYYKKFGRYPKD